MNFEDLCRTCANSNVFAFKVSVFITIAGFAHGAEIEEMVISGEKIERSLQETVSSVGVLTQDQIEEAAIYDLQDVFARIANVSQAFGEEGIAIRGINNNSVGLGGAGGLISMHVDGAPMSNRAIRVGQAELWDVRQVEVFRGAQSTNQGRSSLGGAVNIKTNDPSYEWGSSYRALYGEYNTHALSAAFGGPILDEQLAFRIAIDDQQTDGYVENRTLNDDRYGASGNTVVRGKLLLEPEAIKGLKVLSTFSYSDNESGDPFASKINDDGAPISPFDRLSFANVEGFEDHEQSIAILDVAYELSSSLSLTSLSTWNESKYDRKDDSDRQNTEGEAALAARIRPENAETLTQEIRLNLNTSRVQGNLGVYYYQRDDAGTIGDVITQNFTNGIISGINIVAPEFSALAPVLASLYPVPAIIERDGVSSGDVENQAVYGNLNIDLNDMLTLFGGFRYDQEKVSRKNAENRTLLSALPDPTNLPAPLAATAPIIESINGLVESSLVLVPLDSETDYEAFLPAIGVTLNWSNQLNTSFRIQRAYRAGGAGTSSGGNFEFDPEFTTNYELSLRSQWFENKLTLNANIYHVDWTDQQVQVVDGASSADFKTINAGESELNGFEVELTAYPTDTVSLFMNVGYADTEFKTFDVALNSGEQDFSGSEFLGASDITSAAGFNIDISSQLRFQADINYLSDSLDRLDNNLTEEDESLRNDARTVINSKLTYEFDPRFEVSIIGRNLADEEYITRSDTAGTDTVNIGQPRVIAMQLQGRF